MSFWAPCIKTSLTMTMFGGADVLGWMRRCQFGLQLGRWTAAAKLKLKTRTKFVLHL